MPVDATALGELPIFGMLSGTSELETLAAGAERIEVGEPGIELMRQGDFGHSVFVVLEGRAQVAVEGRVVREVSRWRPLRRGRGTLLGPPHRDRCLVDEDGAGRASSSATCGRSRRRTRASQPSCGGCAQSTSERRRARGPSGPLALPVQLSCADFEAPALLQKATSCSPAESPDASSGAGDCLGMLAAHDLPFGAR